MVRREALEELPSQLLYLILEIALQSDDNALLEQCLLAWVCVTNGVTSLH